MKDNDKSPRQTMNPSSRRPIFPLHALVLPPTTPQEDTISNKGVYHKFQITNGRISSTERTTPTEDLERRALIHHVILPENWREIYNIEQVHRIIDDVVKSKGCTEKNVADYQSLFSTEDMPPMVMSASPKQQIDQIPWIQWGEFVKRFSKLKSINENDKLKSSFLQLFANTNEEFKLWVTLQSTDKHVLMVLIHSSKGMTMTIYADETYQEKLITFTYDQDHVYNEKIYDNTTYETSILKKILTVFKDALTRPQKPKKNVKVPQASQALVVPLPAPTKVNKGPKNAPIKTDLKPSHVHVKPQKERPLVASKGSIICCEDLTEFKEKLVPLTALEGFDAKLNYINRIMTREDRFSKMWVTLDQNKNKHLMIAMEQTKEFFSNTFIQTTPIPERPKEDKTFTLICFYENQEMGDKNILLHWRISKGGGFSELVGVKATEKISGNDLMNMLDILNKGLQVKHILLEDCATIGKEKLPLRIMRPLTHPDQQTWYQRHGFELYPCQGIPDEFCKPSDRQGAYLRFIYTHWTSRCMFKSFENCHLSCPAENRQFWVLYF